MEFNDLIVIEWSIGQGCFHSHTIKDMVKENIILCTGGGGFSDYIPIGVFKTEEESIAFMEKIEPQLDREA